jgi:hypothetical protein
MRTGLDLKSSDFDSVLGVASNLQSGADLKSSPVLIIGLNMTKHSYACLKQYILYLFIL